MRQILELSIFYFLNFFKHLKCRLRLARFLFLSFLLSGISLEANLAWTKTLSVQQVPGKNAATRSAHAVTKSHLPPLLFLEQAEDVEREAWWIITNKRVDGVSSPFRVFRAVSLPSVSQAATAHDVPLTKINFKFCKSLLVFNQAPNTWRIESACQKPSTEIGVLQKLASNPDRWKISWKTGPFSDHFGLSTAILFNQQSCEIDLDLKGHISRMSCPHYVRDRKVSEIVELKTFEYKAQAQKILKLEGDVKKDLQVIATFNTDVPLSGDIVLKVKKVPQKAVEEKTEFSNMVQPVPTRGDSHGQKTNKEAGKNVDEKNGSENRSAEEKSRNENGDQQTSESIDKKSRTNEGQQVEEENRGYDSREENREGEGDQVDKKNGDKAHTGSDSRFNENRNQETGTYGKSYENSNQNNDGSSEESNQEHGTGSDVPAIEPSPSVPAPSR